MNVHYDPKVDAAYISFSEKKRKVVETKELSDEIFLDYDENGQPLGLEILGVSEKVPSKTLHFFETQTNK